MKNTLVLSLSFGILLVVLVSIALSGETTDTVAIRKILDAEAIGWERADLKLLLDLYTPHFVGYAGYTTADTVRWQVSFSNFDEFADFAKGELQREEGGVGKVKYTVMRRDTYFDVRVDKAIVVTQDSVRVTDRQTGKTQIFSGPVFWTFVKEEEDWIIASFVGRGFPTRKREERVSGPPDKEIAKMLEETDAKVWNQGDIGGILSRYSDDDFVGYSGEGGINLGAWKVYFHDIEDFKDFLKNRFSRTSYKVNREVIYNHTKGRQAVILTKESISTTHKETKQNRKLERYTLWTLAKSGNKWQITSFYLNVGLPEAG